MNYNKEIETVLNALVNESTVKVILKEDFGTDFQTLINTAWQLPAEKQLVKTLYKNKDNVIKNPEAGKKYLSQLYNQNKSLIIKSCSTNFLNTLKTLTGDTTADSQGMAESKIIKNKLKESSMLNEWEGDNQNEAVSLEDFVLFATNDRNFYERDFQPLIKKWQHIFKQGNYNEKIAFNDFFQATKRIADAYQRKFRNAQKAIFSKPELLDATRQIFDHYLEEIKSSFVVHENKQNKMYRYYKIQSLNEAAYVAIPPFLVDTNREHETVLEFALESKQLKTDKGVDYVVEVSPQEFEEVTAEIEGTFGAEAKDAKPQDASIDFSKNQFDKVKAGKDGGAKQDEGKKLHESKWDFLFEAEDAAYHKKKQKEYEQKVMKTTPHPVTGENPKGDEYARKAAEHEKKWRSLEKGINEGIGPINTDGSGDDEWPTGGYGEGSFNKKTQKLPSDEDYFAESDGGDNDIMGDESTKHMTRYENTPADEISEDLDRNDPVFMRMRANQNMKQNKPEPQKSVKDVLGGFLDKSTNPAIADMRNNGVPQSKPQRYKDSQAYKDLVDYYAQWGVTPEEVEANPDILSGDGSIIESVSCKIHEEIDNAQGVESIEENSAAFDKATGQAHFAESSAAWDKATGKSHYAEDEDMGQQGYGAEMMTETLYENDTADMAVPEMPAYQTKEGRKRVEGLDVYGDDSDTEHIADEEVLQENFEKFVLKNCQGAYNYVKNGKLNLKEFLDNKSFGFISLLKESFLKENEQNGEFEVEDVNTNNGQMTVVYYYPSDKESRDLTFPEQDFWDYMEETDPNWEEIGTSSNFEDSRDGYWQRYNSSQQMAFLKQFLITKKGVSKKL
jgi:hypothetical protein